MCFATSGCSCVRSSMRFLKLWWQIALEWLHDVASALCWGGSWSTKPCVFPCKVAAAGDERYLVCAAVAAPVVSCANCSSYKECSWEAVVCFFPIFPTDWLLSKLLLTDFYYFHSPCQDLFRNQAPSHELHEQDLHPYAQAAKLECAKMLQCIWCCKALWTHR